MPRQRGGFAVKNLFGQNLMRETTSDLLSFYNRYLEKAFITYPNVKVDSVPSGTNSLIVIDMQKDFTYPNPFPENMRSKYSDGFSGAFSVVDGFKLIDPLIQFIETNIDKFDNITFSRDIHDENHCSFAGDRKGWFPPHCIINTPGAEFMPEFEKLSPKVIAKSKVIFKGMHPDIDSFGALKYSDDDYYSTRQSPSCCQTAKGAPSNSNVGISCSNLTGGKYLRNGKTGFEPNPFSTMSQKYDDIKQELGEQFKVEKIVSTGTGNHNIFIVGLAGDWCVRDTAVNIAKATNGKLINGKTVNVYVIQEFTRYPSLPFALKPEEVTDTLVKELKEQIDDKDLTKYVIQTSGTYSLLMKSELDGLTPEILKSDFSYSHFITDPRDFVNQYSKTGVKMLITAPTMQGGRRNRQTRYRKTRRLRRTRHRSRRHN